MKFNRFVTVTLLFVFSVILISCTATSKMTDSAASSESTAGPAWYLAGGSDFFGGQNGFGAYATALAGDSSEASVKAITQARMELKSGVSGRLEQIREKALEELGSDSGLGTSGFLLTLRQAENTIPGAAQMTNVKAENGGSNEGYRGFAKVTISKQVLLEALDAAMSRYKTAWNAMKTSQAFKGF